MSGEDATDRSEKVSQPLKEALGKSCDGSVCRVFGPIGVSHRNSFFNMVPASVVACPIVRAGCPE